MKRFLSLCGLLLALTGCSAASSDGTVPVTGKVTLDGAPLATGTISLVPSDGQGTSAGSKIVNGEFQTNIAPGKKQVRIYSEKVIGQQPRSPSDPSSEKVDVTQQILPKKYNDATTLSLDVPAGGTKTAEFPLTSK